MSALPHLVVMHGANACAAVMEPLAQPLRTYAQVHVANLPGHGGRPLPPQLRIADMAADLLGFLDRSGIDRAVFVGYSTGGLISLHLARHHPERVLGACTIATRTFLDEAGLKHWSYLAHPDRLSRPGNPRAGEMLRDHGPDWKAVALANIALFGDIHRNTPLTDADLAAIRCPVMLVNANRDQIVPWEETLRQASLIAGSRVVMFYGLGHPLASVPVNQVGRTIGQWAAELAKA